jgi:hypothetical protein
MNIGRKKPVGNQNLKMESMYIYYLYLSCYCGIPIQFVCKDNEHAKIVMENLEKASHNLKEYLK